MIGRSAAVVGACFLVALCSVVGRATALPDVVLARKSATGLHAQAVPSAYAGHYKKIVVFVTARPNQRVTGSWTVSCHSGTSSSRDAEDLKGRTPLGVAVRPSWSANEACLVVGAAKLARRGRITVALVAH
jgi:hypothetical protein